MNTLNKATWRTLLRTQRREMYDAARNLSAAVSPTAAVGRDLARTGLAFLDSLGSGQTVCAYVSMAGEPPTDELLQILVGSGRKVYVPVCEPEYKLSWTPWYPAVTMVRSALAPVMEPVGPRLPFVHLAPVTAILIPALAVDLTGVRLGQGGGYYDRFLPSNATVPVAAVVYGHEVFPAGELPHNKLDAPVNYALTPTQYRALGHTTDPFS